MRQRLSSCLRSIAYQWSLLLRRGTWGGRGASKAISTKAAGTSLRLLRICVHFYKLLLKKKSCYISLFSCYVHCSILGSPLPFTISLSLLKFMSIELVTPSNYLILCCPPSPLALNLSQGSFPMNQPFASGGQSIGVSASASVLPMNIQGWFPLGLAGLICLLSEGLSSLLQQVWKSQFFGA